MTFAIVKVFPEPVMPRRTCVFLPCRSPSVSRSIACAWSPAGWKSDFSLNIICPPDALAQSDLLAPESIPDKPYRHIFVFDKPPFYSIRQYLPTLTGGFGLDLFAAAQN